MTETSSLEQRYASWVLVVLTGIATLGLAVLYSRGLQAAAEVEWLDSIPVLAEEPDVGDGRL